eukprot:symbB.v1.2.023987.t1/scaffold2239.1/size84866/4
MGKGNAKTPPATRVHGKTKPSKVKKAMKEKEQAVLQKKRSKKEIEADMKKSQKKDKNDKKKNSQQTVEVSATKRKDSRAKKEKEDKKDKTDEAKKRGNQDRKDNKDQLKDEKTGKKDLSDFEKEAQKAKKLGVSLDEHLTKLSSAAINKHMQELVAEQNAKEEKAKEEKAKEEKAKEENAETESEAETEDQTGEQEENEELEEPNNEKDEENEGSEEEDNEEDEQMVDEEAQDASEDSSEEESTSESVSESDESEGESEEEVKEEKDKKVDSSSKKAKQLELESTKVKQNANALQANSTTHKADWARFTRQCMDRKKKAQALMEKLKKSEMYEEDEDFPKDEEVSTSIMWVRLRKRLLVGFQDKNPDKDMMAALTGEGGVLGSGMMPKIGNMSEQGEKALAECLEDTTVSKRKAPKAPKTPKEPEEVIPKTIQEEVVSQKPEVLKCATEARKSALALKHLNYSGELVNGLMAFLEKDGNSV